jgi:RNA polymerase sigma-70 factor (ECF subfamily)
MTTEPISLGARQTVQAALTFEDFFIAEHERLFKALYMLTGNREESDDLAQEALLRAFERWDRVGTMDSPAGYVYRTALNLHRNRLRGLLVRARRVFAAVPQEDVSVPLSESHDVRNAVAQLPRGQREVLVLVDWLGLGSEEAGEVLGIEASSVRGRLHRAHASLRARLGGIDG